MKSILLSLQKIKYVVQGVDLIYFVDLFVRLNFIISNVIKKKKNFEILLYFLNHVYDRCRLEPFKGRIFWMVFGLKDEFSNLILIEILYTYKKMKIH